MHSFQGTKLLWTIEKGTISDSSIHSFIITIYHDSWVLQGQCICNLHSEIRPIWLQWTKDCENIEKTVLKSAWGIGNVWQIVLYRALLHRIAFHQAKSRKFKTTSISWNILFFMVMAAMGLTEQALVRSLYWAVCHYSNSPANLSGASSHVFSFWRPFTGSHLWCQQNSFKTAIGCPCPAWEDEFCSQPALDHSLHPSSPWTILCSLKFDILFYTVLSCGSCNPLCMELTIVVQFCLPSCGMYDFYISISALSRGWVLCSQDVEGAQIYLQTCPVLLSWHHLPMMPSAHHLNGIWKLRSQLQVYFFQIF